MTTTASVLVTGGSGYIAGFCIRQLLDAGYTVRTTVRSLEKELSLRALFGGAAADRQRLTFHQAELLSDDGWAEAMRGVTYVLHVASPVATEVVHDDDVLVKPAREGTLRVLKAARDAGVKRVVVTSSVASVAYGAGGRSKPFDETEWSDVTNLADTSAYERSKTLAERAAWDFMKAEGGAMEMVTVNPGLVVGPVMSGDFSGSVEAIKKLLDGSVPGFPRLGWPLVDVRDIADLHVRAMTAPNAAGQRYLGAGDFYWMREVAGIVRDTMPGYAKRLPKWSIPDVVVRLVALFDPVLRGRLFELGKERRVDNTKARTELGWQVRPIAETVQASVESLVRVGVLKA